MRRNIPWFAFAAVLIIPLMPSAHGSGTLLAQTSEIPGHRQRVTVALVDTLPRLREPFAAVIVRSPGASGHDVILLPRATASGQLLDMATRVLLDARVRQGDHPTAISGKPFQQMMIGVRGKSSRSPLAEFEIALAQRVVDRLQQAQPRELAGIGKVPSLDYIPPPIRKAAPTS